MRLVFTGNPTTNQPGQTVLPFTAQTQTGSKLLIHNESNANGVLTFPNGATSPVLANDRRFYCLTGLMAQPHSNYVFTTTSYIPNLNTINMMYVEIFDPGEPIQETYPAPIVRQTNTGVNVVGNTLVNTGNNPGANVVTVQALGDSGNVWTMDNTGIFTLGDLTYQGHIDFNGTPTNLPASSGGSGSVDCLQPFRGIYFKVLLINQNSFKNGSSAVDWVLPAAFVKGGMIYSGGVTGFGVKNGGTLQNISVISTLGSNAGPGSAGGTGASYMFGYSYAEMVGPFDTVEFQSGSASTHTGTIVIIGR